MKFLLALQSLVALFQVSLAAGSSCYTPNGTYVQNNFPCFPDQEYSVCCQPGYACMSNNLCHVTPASPDWNTEVDWTTRFSRYGCTDPTWRSPNCPSFCRAYNGIQGEGVDLCDAATEKYCCTYSTDDSCTCIHDNGFVLIANASTVTLIPTTATNPAIDPSASTSLILNTSSRRSSSTSSVSTSATSAAASTLSSGSASSSSNSVSNTAGAGAASTSAATGSVVTTSGVNVTAVAVGVVVPVVVIAALIAGFFVWRHHRRPRAAPPTQPGLYMGEYSSPAHAAPTYGGTSYK